MGSPTVLETIDAYLDTVSLSRSANTARTYRNAMNTFLLTLQLNHIDPERTDAGQATLEWLTDFISDLKTYAPTTERLYITAVTGWFEFLAAENIAAVNLPGLRVMIRRRARRPGQRLPQFPQNAIQDVLIFAETLSSRPAEENRERLILLRDSAFLLTLADTGLRVHEACNLRRGDVDWQEGHAIIIGKGNQEAVVRFSERALRALRTYLNTRSAFDGNSGRPLSSLPLFARHDKGAGKRILPVSTTTGRAIIHTRVEQALGPDAVGSITPHSFRHYFVTTVLRASGGNLKLAQELARHKNIAVTQRYAHLSDDELDRSYHEIFNQ
ncbi:MAG: tyrosine-type recombinase/integrase [Anaerolineales bacterium]|nr:tyrosine-type recombinase/integrase [Anaerolineales bacterium]